MVVAVAKKVRCPFLVWRRPAHISGGDSVDSVRHAVRSTETPTGRPKNNFEVLGPALSF